MTGRKGNSWLECVAVSGWDDMLTYATDVSAGCCIFRDLNEIKL